MMLTGPTLNETITQIYENTYDDVFRYIVSKARLTRDAPDILQNVYLRLMKRMQNGGMISDPKRYLLKTAKHELYRYYGVWSTEFSNLPVFSRQEDELFDAEELELSIQAVEESTASAQEIWAYLETCNEKTKQIFILHFSLDLTIAETAKRLGLKESTVKSRLYRTIRDMQTMFSAQEGTA